MPPGDTRSNGHLLRFSSFELDLRARELRKQGLRIKLQEQPFQILALLLEKPGEIVTREYLLEEIWGYEFYPTTRTVDNHILRLRQKLEENSSDPRFILSVYGEGYKFVG